MEWNDLELCFSPARLNRYKVAYNGDIAKATLAYPHNLQLAEALLPCLKVLEITLRNNVHQRLKATYGIDAWWTSAEWIRDPSFTWQNTQILAAHDGLRRRMEAQSPDKVVAELSFGFWTSLFNAQFQDNLWGPLRHAFPRCPKKIRKRDTIAKALNQIRYIRNRAFHHEPLLWLGPTLEDQYRAGMEVIDWLNPKLRTWLVPLNRFPDAWQLWTKAQKTHGL